MTNFALKIDDLRNKLNWIVKIWGVKNDHAVLQFIQIFR